MTRTRYRIFENAAPYFLTSTIVAWLPLFAQPRLVEKIFNSWRLLQRERDIQIFAYVIMENHLHWIAAGPDLSRQVANFKSFTGRQIIDEMKRLGMSTSLQELSYFKLRHKIDQEFQVWQEGSHPQEIGNEKIMEQKVEYIHDNPLRRGYVDDPTHWRYSSARNYARQPGLIEVVTDWG